MDGCGVAVDANLAVSPNEETAPAGVDTVAGERIDFDLLYSGGRVSGINNAIDDVNVPSVRNERAEKSRGRQHISYTGGYTERPIRHPILQPAIHPRRSLSAAASDPHSTPKHPFCPMDA